MTCPRCLSDDCTDPDLKACSDNCIARHLAEVARLRAALRGLLDAADEPAFRDDESSIIELQTAKLRYDKSVDAARAALAPLEAPEVQSSKWSQECYCERCVKLRAEHQ